MRLLAAVLIGCAVALVGADVGAAPPQQAAAGGRARPRPYARPYIQRVWLPSARNASAFRANHSQSIRDFAYAINDTATFLRFLREEEERLGLRLGTDEDAFNDTDGSALASAFASASASVGASASASASAEASYDEYDNSLSGDRLRTEPPTTTTAATSTASTAPAPTPDQREGRQPRAQWFHPVDDDDPSIPATVLPFVAFATTLYPSGSYRGLTAAPSEIRNRTTPYTVTPVAAYYAPNATFVYESYANGFVGAVGRRVHTLPQSSALAPQEPGSSADESQFDAFSSERRLRNGVSSSSQDLSDSASYFSTSNEEPETEERGVAPSAYARYPGEYRDVRRPDSGHAGRYVFGLRAREGGDEDAPASGVQEFRNRPMFPMGDAATYNLQTAPRNSSRQRPDDPMVMSPSTMAPHVVEVFSVSPGSYYLSSTIQPPVMDNGTAYPVEYHQAPSFNHFVESTGVYPDYGTPNEFKHQRKMSARYQSAAVVASNPLVNYNPFSIFPKYRATFVPKKEHSVKVLSASASPQPPAAPPTLLPYAEEPFAALERGSLAASRGASGNLAPTELPAPGAATVASTAASTADSTVQPAATAASYALPLRYSGAVGARARGRGLPHAAAARARGSKAARRRHRKGRRRGVAGRGARFGVARMLLPPPAPRKVARVAAAITVGPQVVPETWQWQEGLLQPQERRVDDAAASAVAQRRAPPTSASTAFAPTYAPPSAPTAPPTPLPTFPSPEPERERASASQARRAGRAPAQRSPKHPRRGAASYAYTAAASAPAGGASANALPDDAPLSSGESEQYRRREKVSLGQLRPDGIGEHGSIPGVPGRDYPTYSKPPVRNFSCLDLKGRRGYVADPSTRCQVFYICPGDGRGKAMLCPNGTVFNQDVSVCDWWFNVKCGDS